MKFRDIEEAYEFVSFGSFGEHEALLDRKTGQVYCRSDLGDLDEITEELWESDDTVKIPDRNDLDLGRRLVFRFAGECCPDDYDCVREFFSRRGAYARFKDFLEQKDLVQAWHDFEANATEEALRQWCQDNGIELAD